MSVKVMSWVWDHAQVDASEIDVLLVIADHADDRGQNAWPAVETIAVKSRRSPRRVQQIIRALSDRGVLRVESQRGGTPEMRPDRRPNRYEIVMVGVKPVAPRAGDDGVKSAAPGTSDDGVQPTAPGTVVGVKPMVSTGCNPGSSRGEVGFTQFILEPSLKTPCVATSSHREGESIEETPPGRRRDEVWDALVEVLGHGPVTASERGGWNRACKQLRDADATPGEIRVRAGRWALAYPGARLTPPALARHWGELAPPAVPARPRRREAAACAVCDSTGWVTADTGDVTGCPACTPALAGART